MNALSRRTVPVMVISLLAAAANCLGQAPLPVVTVTADNTEIKKSCVVDFPPDVTIADTDGNGVIHIRTPGIRVVFKEGAELWGGPKPDPLTSGPWDTYSGIGIRIEGAKGVTIRGAKVHGFKVGIWAADCDDLRIDGGDLSDNYRQRLKSTPESEDSSDWLFPHHNEKDEWATQHGAGLYIRGSAWPTVSGVRVRRGQNGILLHSVRDGLVYDNDCSFLSGWGLGMFRTSGTTVSRNAFDFCVRGYSHDVYNRGQDSAGILMFEQCSKNLILENSCTHSGDGVFGFAGLEALNGEGAPADFDFTRKGCNDNLFAGNDLSFAAAHGLEMTFSFGNTIVRNKFEDNAICGIWGGYSQDTLITGNQFERNGGMAYGLERGGVNIEHGANNRIIGNEFTNNRCAVHLWWDEHADFETKGWGKANYKGVSGNIIAGNAISVDAKPPSGRPHPEQPFVGLHVRDVEGSTHVTGTVYARNTSAIDPSMGVDRLISPGVQLVETWDAARPEVPGFKASGATLPVGARVQLRGRDKIIMGEWGPWDHEGPMVRRRSSGGPEHVYEVFGSDGDVEVSSGLKAPRADGPGVIATVEPATDRNSPSLVRIVPAADRNGAFTYRFMLHTGLSQLPISGVIVSAPWQVTAFSWDDASDPRKDLAAWRALAQREDAFSVMTSGIDFQYGHGGPKDQKWAGPIRELAPGADRFGMIARARMTLGKGRWRLRTLSDDGVRVMADGATIIENWTWHAPTPDTGVLELSEEREVELIVEHFEIDGFAVLKLDITPEP